MTIAPLTTPEILAWAGFAAVFAQGLSRSKVCYVTFGITGLALGVAACITALGGAL